MRVSLPHPASFLFKMPLFRAKCLLLALRVLGMDAYVKNMMVREDNQGGVNAQLPGTQG